MGAAILLSLVLASANKSYTVLALGYQGASVACSVGDSTVRSIDQLAPQLSLTAYGGDWFLKIDAGVAATRGDRRLVAHSSPYIGSLEVGTHLPTLTGMLAVGLHVGGTRAGLEDHARSAVDASSWIAGGTGVDGGLSVHYALPLVELVRVDPAIAFGASYVGSDGAPAYSGLWALAELEVLVKVASFASLELGTAFELRRYARADGAPEGIGSFDGRALRFELGVAFHDLFGFGSNRF